MHELTQELNILYQVTEYPLINSVIDYPMCPVSWKYIILTEVIL